MSAIPNMRVYLPSDRHQTKKLFQALLLDQKCAYIRTGRNPVEDIYSDSDCPFQMDRATILADSDDFDAAIVACGEMVRPAIAAAHALKSEGINAAVVDMFCVKPIDREAILTVAQIAKIVITVEEHTPFGGLGSMVSQIVASECPKRVINLSLPDTPVITGTSREVFDTYGLNAGGIVRVVKSSF